MNSAAYGPYFDYFESRVLPAYPVIHLNDLNALRMMQGPAHPSFDSIVYCLVVALGASHYALESTGPQQHLGVALAGVHLAVSLFAKRDTLSWYSPMSEARACLLMVVWCKQTGALRTAVEYIPHPYELHHQWCGPIYSDRKDVDHTLVCTLQDAQIAILMTTIQLTW